MVKQARRIKHFTEKAGLMGGGERVIYEYLITAQNNKKTNEVISFTDHIPVSQNEMLTKFAVEYPTTTLVTGL